MEKDRDKKGYHSDSILGKLYDLVATPQGIINPQTGKPSGDAHHKQQKPQPLAPPTPANVEPEPGLVLDDVAGDEFWEEVKTALVVCYAYNTEVMRWVLAVTPATGIPVAGCNRDCCPRSGHEYPHEVNTGTVK